MLTVATCLWDANKESRHFSRCYDETWAEKLYRGVAANLTRPFRFVVHTDRERSFSEPIDQRRIQMDPPHYGACMEPFMADEATLFMGLDTIIVGSLDALADYCFSADKPAVPLDPYIGASPWRVTNAVVAAPKGCRAILYDGYAGENDMDWMNTRDVAILDDLFPRAVVSYKGRIQYVGLEDETRIVFFHGATKPHQIPQVGWVARLWHDNVNAEAAA